MRAASRVDGSTARGEGPVLVVDDDEDIREIVAMVLAEEGHEVEVAANGAEALERLRRSDAPRPRLILLDLMMPVMNAEELRDALDEEKSGSTIPIVLLSGDARVAEKASRLGAVAALTKPISLAQLLEVVERYGCSSPPPSRGEDR